MESFKLRCVLLLVGLMTIMNLFSQDKHDYATPLGKSVFYREVTDANRTVLRMSEVGPLSAGVDGLVVSFNMRQNLSQVTRPLKLLSFNSTSEEANSHFEIYYSAGTTVGFSSFFAFVNRSRSLQCHKTRLSLGPDLCRLPCQETGRGEALQRCALSCGKEIGTSDFCNGEISAAILRRTITPIFHKLK